MLHVGEPRLERVADALEARRRSISREVAQRERRIAGRHRGPRLLDADEVRVQRLAAVVELDLDVRELQLEVLADALRSRPRARRLPTSTVTISLSSSTSWPSSVHTASAGDCVAATIAVARRARSSRLRRSVRTRRRRRARPA